MRLADPQLVDLLAARYALGTLGPSARRRFERLLSQRADVALAVAQWQERLAQLASSVPSVEPPPRVWRAIDSRTRPSRANTRWWHVAGWGGSGVIAGALAVLAFVMTAPALFVTADRAAMEAGGKLPQSYVGLLTDPQGNGKLLVSSLRHGRAMTMKVIGPIAPPPAGQRLVLWALPANRAAFKLGNVPDKGSATVQLPDTSEKLLSQVQKLAVTSETSDAPAMPGTVVYSGNCAKLW